MSTASSQVPSSDDDLSRATEFQTVREEYVQLFSLVRAHGSDAFIWVIRSLCALGSDLSSVPARHEFSDISSQMRSALGIVNRRMSALMDRPTFAVEELRLLAVENVDLLMGSRALADTATDTDSVGSEGWSLIMHHLLDTTTYAHTPSPIRTQACEAVSDVVLAAMELVTRADGLTEDDDLASEGINSHFVAMVAN
ncbi:Endocytosis and vacuole integrity protein, partial [Linderina pennispora]